MSDYPRNLLISESVIRDFEERVGVRFINKTECAKAIDEHDAKVKADERAKVIDHIEKYMITSICSSCDQEACEGGMAESIQECETIRFLKDAIHDAITEMKEIKT